MRPSIDALRFAVATPIIAAHLLSFYLILSSSNVATLQERVDVSLIIGPIFAVYVAAIVRKISSLMTQNWDATPVHPLFAVLAIVVATIFAVSVPATLLSFIHQGIATTQDLKTTLGILETALGLYTGSLIESLFGSHPKD
ncbi:hypothetical protein [Rhodopseudomonas pseudopalustris]|uniref:hypothetical protein n=1 Tax=Rhodopseudomonas pseudopalustris TaxID=1513892 RepID=UPI0005A0F435|nr:hypothetical protein [Rhodopseudomonas pseudopalustris]MBB1091741.1 hypothetical protein [Rhodopseudomonas palustris]